MIVVNLQWNLDQMTKPRNALTTFYFIDTCLTLTANTFVHFRQVSTLDMLGLGDFEQEIDIFGQSLLSALGMCPL